MKITDATKQTYHEITIVNDFDQEDYYRRNSKDSWEILYGSTWETVYFCDGLEMIYQEYCKKEL